MTLVIAIVIEIGINQRYHQLLRVSCCQLGELLCTSGVQ